LLIGKLWRTRRSFRSWWWHTCFKTCSTPTADRSNPFGHRR